MRSVTQSTKQWYNNIIQKENILEYLTSPKHYHTSLLYSITAVGLRHALGEPHTEQIDMMKVPSDPAE